MSVVHQKLRFTCKLMEIGDGCCVLLQVVLKLVSDLKRNCRNSKINVVFWGFFFKLRNARPVCLDSGCRALNRYVSWG